MKTEKIINFREDIKIGDFITCSCWCADRMVRVEYVGKERGMGTLFYGDRCTGREVPFTFAGYEKYRKVSKPNEK